MTIVPTSSSLSVTWSQPSDENKDLTKQVVEWTCGGNTDDSGNLGGSIDNHDITGLQAGTFCSVTVRVFTAYEGREYQADNTTSAWTG